MSENFSYEYDFLDRLTFVEGLDVEEEILYSQRFDYDSIGNILQVGNFTYPTPTSTPDLTATPVATATPPPPDGFEYDDNGNMSTRTHDGVTWTQGFNAENRLNLLSSDPNVTTDDWVFVYDGDGNRVKQTDDAEITLYLAGGSFEVRDAGDGNKVFKYYAIAGQRLAMRSEGATKFLLTDHLGSVVSVLGSNGIHIEGQEQRYMPYGEPRFEGGITVTDFGFTGQRVLGGTGLMDYRARFYDSKLGKFTQPDTLGISFANPQSWNRFAYLENNPINFVDPSGHYVACPPGGCTGGGGGGICYYCNWGGTPSTPPPPVVGGGGGDEGEEDEEEEEGGGGGGGGNGGDGGDNESHLVCDLYPRADSCQLEESQAGLASLCESNPWLGACQNHQCFSLIDGPNDQWIRVQCGATVGTWPLTVDLTDHSDTYWGMAIDVGGIIAEFIPLGSPVYGGIVEVPWALRQASQGVFTDAALLIATKYADYAATAPGAGIVGSGIGLGLGFHEIATTAETVVYRTYLETWNGRSPQNMWGP